MAGAPADADATVVAPPPRAAPAAPDAGLRFGLVEAALAKPGEPARRRLDAFLEAPDPAVALAAWFGDFRQLGRPLDAGRVAAALDRDIAAIDALMSDQVDAVLHARRFQRLEAIWRGSAYLVRQSAGDEEVKIRLLDLSWAELCRDLERAVEFDQSQLFDKVYNAEFGMPGGEPYGLLIGDYEVRHRRAAGHPTDDIAALKNMSQVAAAAFAPFVVGASPAMLGLDGFGELALPLDLGSLFRQVEYSRWRSLRDSEDARFVGVTLPRVLMRLPYRDDPGRTDRFRFREDTSAQDLSGYLWATAGFAFAAVAIRAFADFGWFADIRGAPRDHLAGGMVAGLPVPSFATDAEGVAQTYSTDASISERLENELSAFGFIPLSDAKQTEYAVFYGNQSVQQPKRYDRALATANAQLSAMLQYILCVSRFSHYVKVLARDRIGSFESPEDCESFLSNWLMDYVTGDDNAPLAVKAQYPLREASVQVREAAGRPGEFMASINLRPHFQLDQVVSSFKLVTEVAGPKAR
jgi:type VI secretion system protein ImpD